MSDRSQKVFCIGLGKTGTTTFAAIMKDQGYNHVTGPVVSGLVARKAEYYDSLWEITSHYDSFDDFPWPLMYKQLSEKYPGAKFLLTKRESPEKWLESLSRHNLRVGPTDAQLLAYGCFIPENNREKLIDMYKRHIEDARNFFNGCDNYLEISWSEPQSAERVSDFLGLAKIPSVPRRNSFDTKDANAVIERLIREGRSGLAMVFAEKYHPNLIPYAREKAINEIKSKAKRRRTSVSEQATIT